MNNVLWYCCPKCGQKLFKVLPGGKAEKIEIKCKNCKQITIVEVGYEKRTGEKSL